MWIYAAFFSPASDTVLINSGLIGFQEEDNLLFTA